MTAAMHGAQVFHLPVTPVEYPPIPHASCEAREDGESGHHRRISELEAQVAELDAYTAAVAHDLRAPLRSIHGYADILTEDHGRELTGDARACVSKIIAAAHEMGRVIDDLLAQVMHVDDRLADAGVAELVKHMVKQRTARDGNQRFRHPVRQRPHAQAQACSEDHGFGGLDGHVRKFRWNVGRES